MEITYTLVGDYYLIDVIESKSNRTASFVSIEQITRNWNFVDRCLNPSYTKRILSEIAPPEAEHPKIGNAATQPADAMARTESARLPKPTISAQNSGVAANNSPTQTIAQHGGTASVQSGNTFVYGGLTASVF